MKLAVPKQTGNNFSQTVWCMRRFPHWDFFVPKPVGYMPVFLISGIKSDCSACRGFVATGFSCLGAVCMQARCRRRLGANAGHASFFFVFFLCLFMKQSRTLDLSPDR